MAIFAATLWSEKNSYSNHNAQLTANWRHNWLHWMQPSAHHSCKWAHITGVSELTSQLQVSSHHRCKWAHITGVSGHYLLQSCHSDFQPSVFCYCSPYSWTFTGPMKTFTKNTIDASMLSGMQCEWTLFTTQNTSQDQEQSVLLPTQWPVASMSGK